MSECLEDIIEAFPEFLTDEPVNGGDLVEFIGDMITRYEAGRPKPSGPFWGCMDCGCTDIEHESWVETNGGKPTDDCGSKNIWCPQCETSEGRAVEVSELRPYDAERDLVKEGIKDAF